MFVEQTVKRNRKLVETAFALHQSGQIMPDSYLIDMDVLIDNAKKILEAAKVRNIRLYAETAGKKSVHRKKAC